MNEPRLPAGEDRGDAWVDAVLEPLRQAEVRCDVATAVMARVAATRATRWPAPSAMLRRPRLIWASCGLAATVAFAFLALPLVGLARQGGLGMRQARAIASASGHLARLLEGQVGILVDAARAAAIPLLRAMMILLDAAAPIFKSAAAVAALTGALSILISLYVFTHARGSAPPAGARSGYLPHGGMR